MKPALAALSLNLLFAAVGLLGPSVPVAEASTDVAVVVSSGLSSRVTITSGTIPVRIDNWDRNAQSGAMVGQPRIGVCFQNSEATNEFYWGFNTSVSSHTGSGVIGFKASSGDLICVGALRTVPIYAVGADACGASGCKITATQLAKE